ncbi:MAG TPA: polyketide synthase dehydratase domain-containing protein, partial [Polyangiales bacterium]|nr:polyketide synthase dehydratase domain-containing protein [Polyangiales bacterium]
MRGTVLLPGTGLVELALGAASAVGLASVIELTLEQPLVLMSATPLQVQVSVGALDDAGQRSVSIFSRVEDASWVRNASGTLGQAGAADTASFEDLRRWDGSGAEAISLEGFYERLRAQGLEYGPVFQGMHELQRAGMVAYSRVKLPSEQHASASQYGVHPALLDAALHSLTALGADDAIRLPFAWSQVELYATGATELRVRTELVTLGSVDAVMAKVHVADLDGQPVAAVAGLRVRPLQAKVLTPQSRALSDLYRIELQPVALPEAADAPEQAVLGGDGRLSALLGCQSYAEVSQLVAAAPRRVIVDLTSVSGDQDGESAVRGETTRVIEHLQRLLAADEMRESAVRSETTRVLGLLQQLLAADELRESELVWVTAGAVSSGGDSGIVSIEHAPVWGLLRTARNEHADRALRSLDIGEVLPEAALLQQALGATKEPELVLRSGVALAPRLCEVTPDAAVAGAWRVTVKESGRLDALEVVPAEDASTALGPNEVRVSVRASGLNFRDVVTALGMVPDGLLGVECAGVVLEVGSEVRNVRVGERVLGMAYGSFASEVRSDARLLAPMPESLSFADAATLPAVFLTAMYALEDLGQLKAGDKLLVHAAAGGVGMAALQLAALAGAEVYATASPSKWPVLRALGLDDDHIASSRDPSFERKWLE